MSHIRGAHGCMAFLVTGRGLHPFLIERMTQSDERNSAPAPAWRNGGPGSLVTRSCMGCQQHRTTTGGTGFGLRWRCRFCIEAKKK